MTRPAALALLLAASSCVSVQVEAPSHEAGPREAGPREAGPLAVVPARPLDAFAVDAARPDGAAGRVPLADGVDYLVVVSGTYSVWAPHFWRRTCVGRAEPAALYPSAVDGPVGMDAAFRFAVPAHARSLCGLPDVSARPGWSYRAAPDDPWTVAPPPDRYDPGHAYVYRVRGAGHPLRARAFEQADWADNYGRLRVAVYAAPAPR